MDEIVNKLDVKQFIELQIKRAQTSTIKELKQEIENDLKLLMKPEFLDDDDKYEIFLCLFLFLSFVIHYFSFFFFFFSLFFSFFSVFFSFFFLFFSIIFSFFLIFFILYHFFLEDNQRKDQIFQYLKEVQTYPQEKCQSDYTIEQQLAEIWTERFKIFFEYDKVFFPKEFFIFS